LSLLLPLSVNPVHDMGLFAALSKKLQRLRNQATVLTIMTPTSNFNLFLNYSTIPIIVLGCRLNEGKLPLKIIQLLLFLGMLYCQMDAVKRWFVDDISRIERRVIIIRVIADCLAFWGCISTSLLFLFKRKSIIVLFKRMFLSLPNQAKNKVVKYSLRTCFSILVYLVGILILRLFATVARKRSSWIEIIEVVVDAPSETFIVISSLTYVSHSNLLYCYISSKLISLRKYISKDRDVCDLLVINESLHSIMVCLTEFDSIFNILPFIWLVINFTFASSNVTLFITDEEQVGYIFTAIFMSENIAVLFVVLFLMCKKRTVMHEIDLMRHKLTFLDSDNQSGSFVINSIERYMESISSFKMSAFYIYEIDGPMFLSFVGAVLTFTVLFVQLTQNRI
jgi:hypothetical protein